ncbi:uncharacterized protein PHALS_03143 [Plasmopara halstedii]|uniref:Uncharacterized protein n=1 Tax=Plasmopara halstedii TaxID=4781 RepID=A0A0P1A8K8_PLAHL|nr:uncharacterized protein PHALS_03143 [Plasmopara halstedii]CEG36598.1 hypothetical protein PHALS_03143 [Plasmopara halstedii]|eukprot:XP_024572967.1 hypothetical protein PHALS_03143 [Plasmopara halstedii]
MVFRNRFFAISIAAIRTIPCPAPSLFQLYADTPSAYNNVDHDSAKFPYVQKCDCLIRSFHGSLCYSIAIPVSNPNWNQAALCAVEFLKFDKKDHTYFGILKLHRSTYMLSILS